MSRNGVLYEALNEVLSELNETNDFKERLEHLVRNTMEDTYHEDDILAVIELITLGVGE
ncbi:hypothetical protein [Pontibacillus salipaludis]|uniref:Uncharacterized protein n=1 Tax=Pontibacillus salipaludis TaxID=1697394 RepID=A0ABQ1PII8_9BACI|nr:hypothetical protein [Pontibacillus salipaludis]GGC97898.1 hypothetical protein GCM10011389_01300 [Pontibacillus salipaludis]